MRVCSACCSCWECNCHDRLNIRDGTWQSDRDRLPRIRAVTLTMLVAEVACVVKRVLSPSARKRIAAGQRKRWAAVNAAKQSAPKKRKMSAAGRERIAEATRKRWAEFRAKKAAAK
jgi:hypothetical protein